MHRIHRTSCRERTPTDDTDVHRLGGYGIPAIPTLTNSVDSVNSVGEKIFPQNARNSQKLLAEKSLPQMSTEHTETSCREEPPTDGTDEHRCRRVWHPCHTHAAKFCVFCEFCGRTAHPKYLCKSVKSVGGHLSRRFCEFGVFCGRTAHPKYLCKSVKSVGGHLCRRFCEFGVFCGRISHSKRRGYGKMPYPPKEKSVGEYTQQEVLCKSVKSVGGHSRRRGYGKMPYPPKEESVGGHLIKL